MSIKKMKAYDVNTVEDSSIIHQQNPSPAFCMGLRWPVAITLIFAVVFYTIGGLISGFVYKADSEHIGVNCSYIEKSMPRHTAINMYGFHSNMAIVGPSFMSFGAGVLGFIILQWCFCRPIISVSYLQKT